MKIVIKRRNWVDWDEITIKKLKKLHLNPSGQFLMWWEYNTDTLDTFVAFNGRGQIMGLCLINYYNKDNKQGGFYVKNPFRKKGVAKALIRRAARYHTFRVFSHDTKSQKLFYGFKSKKVKV